MCHHRDTWDNLRVASPPLFASALCVVNSHLGHFGSSVFPESTLPFVVDPLFLLCRSCLHAPDRAQRPLRDSALSQPLSLFLGSWRPLQCLASHFGMCLCLCLSSSLPFSCCAKSRGPPWHLAVSVFGSLSQTCGQAGSVLRRVRDPHGGPRESSSVKESRFGNLLHGPSEAIFRGEESARGPFRVVLDSHPPGCKNQIIGLS